MVKVNPENKYKLCEAQQIGKVDKIIVLKSSANTLLDCTLEELAKLRILARGCSSAESLDDYLELRKSCHIVEQCGREFYCDCYWGIKASCVNTLWPWSTIETPSSRLMPGLEQRSSQEEEGRGKAGQGEGGIEENPSQEHG